MIAALPLEVRALRATAFYAGLRSGELQALRVENIELFPEGRWGLLHVRQAWDKLEGAQAPKSGAGIRTVPVPEQLYEILDEHLLRLGRTSGLIFGRSAEAPFDYHAVRDGAERAYKAAGLVPTDLQLHECRHSYKAFLEAADIRESRVDRYMGHANHSVQARYSHQFDGKYLEDAQALSAYLRRADSPGRMEQLEKAEATTREVV